VYVRSPPPPIRLRGVVLQDELESLLSRFFTEVTCDSKIHGGYPSLNTVSSILIYLETKKSAKLCNEYAKNKKILCSVE
jgi:regulation of enolase protein 1 (concanavalin A-like superfamily)